MNCLALSFAALIFAAAFLVPQGAVPEVEITAEPHHHLVFENQFVRVFKVEVAPHSETLMHWHRHDYIFVTLGPTEIVNAVQNKSPVSLKLQEGETRFSPASFAHVARNLGDQPFRNVTVELLEDAKLRQSPAPQPNDDRGLEVLPGGTKQILFVKDGIRATEFELQPGGAVPMHHHTGPHMLIAVSDLDIRDDVEGQSPTPGHYNPGDTKWLPGNYTHSVTNIGKQPAKWITLEFP